MNNPIHWPLTSTPWTEAELHAAIDPVLASGQLTMGPRVKEFEIEFAKLVGAKHAVMVNSGSSANLLMVATMRVQRGWPKRWPITTTEAIVPAIAWATTYAPLAQHGYKLRVVDVDPQTLNADMDQVRAAWNQSTRVVVGVSILGTPAPLDDLRNFAKGNGLWFLEDNCESLGATIEGKQTGTFGLMGTFSTFFTHHLSTIEGGMLVTDDSELADIAQCLRAHGWARDLRADSDLRQDLLAPPFDLAYQFLLPGYNLRPTELQAALGLQQLVGFPQAQEWRQVNANSFITAFAGHPHFSIQLPDRGNAIPYGFVLIADTPSRRRAAFAAMDRAGIEYRMVTGGCFTLHPASTWYNYETVTLPNAEHVHRCGFFVGNHPRDLGEEIALLYNTLKGI